MDFSIHQLGVSGAIGRLSEYHLEEDDADRPYISFQSIRLPIHDLRRHGSNRPQRRLFNLVIFNLFTEPHIRNLIHSIM